jgi:transitional endoplasmic reticulum ATPase
MMAKEVQVRVADAKQRDVGHGKVRIDNNTMEKLGITAGDFMEVRGKRTTVAIAWPAYAEDQAQEIARMDGLLRRNAGVALNEFIIIKKAEVHDSQTIVFAPTDVRLSVDDEFVSFVKRRFMDMPFVEGDMTLLSIFGSSVPLVATRTRPHGPVKVTESTVLQVMSEPTPEKKGLPIVSYEDIGGLRGAIQRIREMVELPLRHPELFQRLGIEPPKGIFLYGPPGCGKTLVAKAVANESDANFFVISGPEIMSKFYGESEARLREIFQKAQEMSPSIIFIDELDAIAPKREEVTGEVEHRVVAQLLSLMDGMGARGNIIVIGATNRPNAIDPALRRPGRFDREIEIGVPDKVGRHEILQIHTRAMPLTSDVNLNRLSDISHGYTGADISALCREAAMKSLRRYLPQINLEDERIPSAMLEKMEVNLDDFMNAYREITPTAMREVYVEVPSVQWADVGGLTDIKQELQEAVEWPLKKPEVFQRIGIRPPKGILLFGPPGCGKTMLARAVATESEANFISIKGPELFSKWVGESEKGIREVFRKGRSAAPSIIFFDELDSVAPRRGMGSDDSGASEHVISQLLTEMDGIEALVNVVVIGASNRPDMIDPAILRPGRFDRLIFVPAPDHATRLQILKIHTRNMPLAEGVDVDQITRQAAGYSGADMEAVCREAGLISLRRDIETKSVTMEDFRDALERVKPSMTSEMENWYQGFTKRFKKTRAPITVA